MVKKQVFKDGCLFVVQDITCYPIVFDKILCTTECQSFESNASSIFFLGP